MTTEIKVAVGVGALAAVWFFFIRKPDASARSMTSPMPVATKAVAPPTATQAATNKPAAASAPVASRPKAKTSTGGLYEKIKFLDPTRKDAPLGAILNTASGGLFGQAASIAGSIGKFF